MRAPIGQKGFWLLDVMAGLIVVGVGWLACWRVQVWVQHHLVTQQLRLEVALQLQACLEESRHAPVGIDSSHFSLSSRLHPTVVYHVSRRMGPMGVRWWRTEARAEWIDPSAGSQSLSLSLDRWVSNGDSSSLRPFTPS